jgi:hypothetical protein
MTPEGQRKLAAEIRSFTKGDPIPRSVLEGDGDNLSIERRVARKKGSWWQVPKDLDDSKDDEI